MRNVAYDSHQVYSPKNREYFSYLFSIPYGAAGIVYCRISPPSTSDTQSHNPAPRAHGEKSSVRPEK